MRRARLKIPLAFEVSTILAGTIDGAGLLCDDRWSDSRVSGC